MPQTYLSVCQRGAHEHKIFNKLPKYIVDFVENKKQFIGNVKHLLIDQSSYSVNEFLNCSYDPQGNNYVQ